MKTNPIVLLVDDNQVLTRLLSLLVSSQLGATVLQAHDCEQARRLVHDSFPDVVVTDLNLPDGDGLALVEELFEHRTVRVVLMSAELPSEKVLRARRLFRSVVCLRKPFESQAVLSALRQVMAANEASSAVYAQKDLANDSTPPAGAPEFDGIVEPMARIEGRLQTVLADIHDCADDEERVRQIVEVQLERLLEDIFRVSSNLRAGSGP